MPLVAAILVTAIVWFFGKRLGGFAAKNYNTQAYVDPKSVPDRSIADERDYTTNVLTMMLTPPQAQVATGTGEQISTARLNPTLPESVTFGNSQLDSPNKLYIPVRTG